MATIGKLVVSLSADSAKLTQGLAKSRKGIAKWGASVAKTVAKAGALFAGLGLILGGGLLVAINRNAAAIDDMTKAAGKLNFPIGDFQKFAFIAAKSNLAMDSFGKSMQRMLKTVGDARAGLTTASDAFDQLGLNADTLAKLNPSQQFELIAEAMKDIPSQADKVKIAMDIFGRGGADLLNVFAGDIKGIGDEFDSLGVTITQRQADMVAAFQDAKTTLSTLFSGFARQVTAEVSPALTLLVQGITDSIQKMGGMRVAAIKFSKAIISGIIAGVKGFSAIINSARSFGVELIDLQAKWLAFKSVVTLDNLFDADDVARQFDELAKERFDIQLSLQKQDEFGAGLVGGLESLLDQVGKETVKVNSHVDLYLQNQRKLADEANKTASAMESLTESVTKTVQATKNENISDQFLKFIDQAKRGINSGSSFNEGNFTALDNLIEASRNNAALPETTKAMQDMVDSLRDVKTSTQQTAQAITQSNNTQKSDSIGQLTLNMITDAGEIAGTIWAEAEFLDRLSIFVGNQTNKVTRSTVN